MPDSLLTGKIFKDLSHSLDISRLRHGLITGNIANIQTPDYHARSLDFKKSLNQAMKSHAKHLTKTHPGHYDVLAGTSYRVRVSDTAGVNIDNEMANLSENNLTYRMSIESLLRKFAMLKHTITEGGR